MRKPHLRFDYRLFACVRKRRPTTASDGNRPVTKVGGRWEGVCLNTVLNHEATYSNVLVNN